MLDLLDRFHLVNGFELPFFYKNMDRGFFCPCQFFSVVFALALPRLRLKFVRRLRLFLVRRCLPPNKRLRFLPRLREFFNLHLLIFTNVQRLINITPYSSAEHALQDHICNGVSLFIIKNFKIFYGFVFCLRPRFFSKCKWPRPF